MVTHSSILAWLIPWSKGPGRLQSMGFQRVGHDLVTTTLLYYITWEIDGETVETVSDFILGAPKSLQMVIAAMKLKDTHSLEGKL